MARSEKNETLLLTSTPCFQAFSAVSMLHFLWDGPYLNAVVDQDRVLRVELGVVGTGALSSARVGVEPYLIGLPTFLG